MHGLSPIIQSIRTPLVPSAATSQPHDSNPAYTKMTVPMSLPPSNLMKIIFINFTFLCKGKVYPRIGHEGPEGELRYSSALSLTSALDVGGWSTPRPGRFTPGKDSVPIVQEAGWPPELVWTGAGNLASPLGFDPWTVQPVASRYTDLGFPTHMFLCTL